jgi:hypothetical protein
MLRIGGVRRRAARLSIDGGMIEMALATPASIENSSILNTLVIVAQGVGGNLLCAAVGCQDISGTAYHKSHAFDARVPCFAAEDFCRWRV